ncbi:MAG: hypothetical protein SGPRY_010214 [Prymnesium sp.]
MWEGVGPLLGKVEEAARLYLDGEMEPSCGASSLCASHWIPLPRPSTHPAHALEAHALGLLSLPSVLERLGESVGSLAGLEWWLQDRSNADPPQPYHTDKDLLLHDGEAEERLPLLSSVAYLSDTGGATAVFAQSKRGGSLLPPSPSSLALAFPRRGRLLLFDGSLFHGVLHPSPPASPPSSARPRRTLLVNLWASRPAAANEPASQTPLPLPPLGELSPAPHGELSLPPLRKLSSLSLSARSTPPIEFLSSHPLEEITPPLCGELPPLLLDLPRAFGADADSWRRQLLPEVVAPHLTLASSLHGEGEAYASERAEGCAPAFVVLRYMEEPSEEMQEKRPFGGGWQRDWCDPLE